MSQPSRNLSIAPKWLVMFTVSIGTFMATLDASIVNVSLPSIMASLNTDLPTVQWVVAIYLLVITGLLLTLGRLSDLIGRKPVYMTGLTIFTIGSLLCGLSSSVYLLIASRAVQAVGAAMTMAVSPAILTSAFPSRERGKALGMNGSVVATGLTAGPALGGFIIAAWGWPWIFFINLPVGIIGLIVAQRTLPHEVPAHESHFDIPGAVLLSLSLGAMTLGLNQGSAKGWGSPYISALLVGAVVLGTLFILWERKATHPVLDPSLFRNRMFAAANTSAFVAFVSTFAVTFLMPFYLSQILGYGPRQMGLTLTAVPITLAVVAPLSGCLSDRIGSRTLSSLGLGIAGVGLLLVSRLGMEPGAWTVVGVLVVVGFGSAIFQSPNTSAIMGSVPREMLGVAAGMVATMRNLGMVTGVVVSGAVYTSRRIGYLPEFGGREASVFAFHDAFIVAAAICIIGVAASIVRGPAQSHGSGFSPG